MGLLAQDQGEVSQALQHYEKAISLNPQDATAYYHAGVLYRRQKDFERAVEYLRQATPVAPWVLRCPGGTGQDHLNRLRGSPPWRT